MKKKSVMKTQSILYTITRIQELPENYNAFFNQLHYM